MEEKKRRRAYRKGMDLVHKEKKDKIIFGAWNDDGTATCLDKNKMFVRISREELDNDYLSYSEQNRIAREKRAGQAW